MIRHSTLHHFLLQYIIEKGYGPNVPSICQHFDLGETEVKNSLEALQGYHGVVLHPNSSKIWVVHPFSLAPTSFYVSSKRGNWWGTCAWCSLGIAALLGEDVSITTNFGAEEEQVKIHIVDGQLQEKNLLVHFPVPMQKAWDNVIYTCSNQLVFKNEDAVTAWSQKHQIPRGDIQPIEKIWHFSKEWYGQHLNPNWQKWTIAEAKAIFAKHGLVHPIWDLGDSHDRF